MVRLAALLLVVLLCGVMGPAPLRVSVTPKFAMNKANISVTVWVEKHPDNRGMLVIIDSGMYRASDFEDMSTGLEVPYVRRVFFPKVPEGHYEVIAVLERTQDKQLTARDTFCISGRDTNCAGDN